MNRSMTHRGPDDEGYFSDSFATGSIGLAMRRLSIIDLSTGHQPIYNETGDVVVVYNGETYNFQELRSELTALGHTFKTKSDTEVIVHGYEVWGPEVAAKLNGMFAFALWDKKKERLVIARDHMGIKPLYYAITKNQLRVRHLSIFPQNQSCLRIGR
jgi:asparagine synthase (glutamine-hydrolysing)